MAVDISAGIQRALTRYPRFVMSKNDQATFQQSASKSEAGRSFRPDRKITRLNKQLKSLTKLIKHEPDKSTKEQLLKQRNLVLKDRRDAGNRTRRKKREIETKKAVRRYTQNSWKFLSSILNKSKNDVKPNFTAQQAKETFEFRWKDPLSCLDDSNHKRQHSSRSKDNRTTPAAISTKEKFFIHSWPRRDWIPNLQELCNHTRSSHHCYQSCIRSTNRSALLENRIYYAYI